MESQDIDLLTKHADQNEELKALWEEHQLYEQQLEKLEKKAVPHPRRSQGGDGNQKEEAQRENKNSVHLG